MTEVGFDSNSFGVAASDDHCADMRGPSAGYVIPSIMRKKFIGDTTPKVVRLSNIYRVPQPIFSLSAEEHSSSEAVLKTAVFACGQPETMSECSSHSLIDIKTRP
jgi:hypothetical protein